jgi:hypothetical protein
MKKKERLYSMELHEEWDIGVSKNHHSHLTIIRVDSGWLYNYRNGSKQITSVFVPEK